MDVTCMVLENPWWEETKLTLTGVSCLFKIMKSIVEKCWNKINHPKDLVDIYDFNTFDKFFDTLVHGWFIISLIDVLVLFSHWVSQSEILLKYTHILFVPSSNIQF